MKRVILLILTYSLYSSGILGQKAPIRFGDVSLEDLQMVRYTADTSAPAVILCDYGYFNPSNFKFTRIRRIKILKKDGYDWANSSYPCTAETQIKGITMNLENGKIVAERLKNESIYTDRITENYYMMRVAMPDVKVGSVIDLQFTFFGFMPVWRFQEVIPVKYSELIMDDASEVKFKYNFFGYEPLFLSTPYRWIAKNMPSFKSEPFMSSKENYMDKLEFDIRDIGITSISSSWEAISDILRKLPNFGFPITQAGYLNKLAGTIKQTKSSREEMLKLAYESIKSTVKWNEKESLLTSTPALSFAYRMKIGNSADINLILLQLLRKLDFDAVPVVLSTRENGFLSSYSPSIQKLNYVIVLAKIGDKSFYLDACDQMLPYTLIPFRCLNGSGRIIEESKNDEVKINTPYKEQDFTTYHLKLNDDQSLVGNLILKLNDYSALDFRKKYRKFNSQDEFMEDFKKDKLGLRIKDSKIENIDSIYFPLVEEYNITMENQLNAIANEIYIVPMFYHQLKENPFKMDFRQYPVDYGYNIEKTITTILEIPENYEVSELPSSVKINLPDNTASLTYIAIKSGNTISVKSIFSINKSIFLPGEYKSLKEFYNQVIKKHSEPIVLKKM